MTKESNPTRRQHYVQRAYLGHFVSTDSADKGGIWVYDKKGNSPRLQATLTSGLEKNIYTVKHPKAPAPDMLEEMFTKIESIGYPVIKELATNPKKRTLSAEDIGRLAGYLAAAHFRVPRNIDAAKQLMEAVFFELMKETARNPEKLKVAWESAQRKITGKALSEDDVKDLLEDPERHVKVKADRLAALLLNLRLNDPVGRILLTMNWAICDAPKDSFFVVGDSSLTVFARKAEGTAIFGGGFGLPQVQIHFPVSPTRCLYLSHGKPPQYFRPAKEAVTEVNRRSIAQAERFAFAPYKSNRIQKIIEEFASSSAIKVDRSKVASRFNLRRKEWE